MWNLIWVGVLRGIFKIQVCFVPRKSILGLFGQKWPARMVTVKTYNDLHVRKKAQRDDKKCRICSIETKMKNMLQTIRVRKRCIASWFCLFCTERVRGVSCESQLVTWAPANGRLPWEEYSRLTCLAVEHAGRPSIKTYVRTKLISRSLFKYRLIPFSTAVKSEKSVKSS